MIFSSIQNDICLFLSRNSIIIAKTQRRRGVVYPIICPLLIRQQFFVPGVLQQHEQLIEPVCGNTGAQAANGMSKNGMSRQLTAFEVVHHCNVGAEVAAPAHAHRSEDRHVAGSGTSGGNQLGNQADGGPRRAQCGDGHSDSLCAAEARTKRYRLP